MLPTLSHVGQKRLEKAIHSFSIEYPDCHFTVKWKPYQIDPATAEEGEDFEAYNHRRWGGSGWTNHLKHEGQKDGALFRCWEWWPNTLKAHQLIKFAEQHGIDTSTSNSVIFESVYEKGENISLVSTLVNIGTTELNLPETELHQYLVQDRGKNEVLDEIEINRTQYQITGVPFFIISRENSTYGRPYGLSGAQNPQKLIDIFEQLING